MAKITRLEADCFEQGALWALGIMSNAARKLPQHAQGHDKHTSERLQKMMLAVVELVQQNVSDEATKRFPNIPLEQIDIDAGKRYQIKVTL